MHPVFSLSNLNKLPGPLKNGAQKAAAGSIEDLLGLSALVKEGFQKRMLRFTAPAFYAAIQLDREALTPERWGEIDPSTTLCVIDGVVAALKASVSLIADGAVPKSALLDVWEALEQWLEMLAGFEENLPSRTNAEMHRACMGVLHLLITEGERSLVHRLWQAAGTWVLIARVWARLLAKRDGAGLEIVASLLQQYSHQPEDRVADRIHWNELCNGAGGYDGLSRLLVKQLRYAVRAADGGHLEEQQVSGPLWVLGSMFVDPDEFFYEILLDHGILSAVTACCVHLTDPRAESKVEFFALLLNTLRPLLRACSSPTAMAGAVRAGLLLLYYRCLQKPLITRLRHASPRLMDGLCKIFAETFARFTICLSFLRAAEPWMAQIVSEKVMTDEAGLPPVVQRWHAFLRIVQERLRVVLAFDAGELTAAKACDNLDCARIAPKRELKRCSGCCCVYYCSRVCQRADYEYGHRESCQSQALCRQLDLNMYPKADRTFFRALLAHEHAHRRAEIAFQLLAFLRKNTQLPCVEFSYTSGGGVCTTSVRSLKSVEHELIERDMFEEESDTQILRAYEAAKRKRPVMVHILRTGNEHGPVRVYTLRSESAAFLDGLRKIVQNRAIKAGSGEEKEAMEAVVKGTQRVLESY
ncbi:MYND-type domain-containing protein [Mycena kentingensis (nom. inval.)]|nr:MYND-type domain-containing protein [Mycena kentingensis (nom. inval.)]